jgi:hypothetical protein
MWLWRNQEAERDHPSLGQDISWKIQGSQEEEVPVMTCQCRARLMGERKNMRNQGVVRSHPSLGQHISWKIQGSQEEEVPVLVCHCLPRLMGERKNMKNEEKVRAHPNLRQDLLWKIQRSREEEVPVPVCHCLARLMRKRKNVTGKTAGKVFFKINWLNNQILEKIEVTWMMYLAYTTYLSPKELQINLASFRHLNFHR